MARRCQTLPLHQLLAYAHTHVVFNQDHLLRRFIDQKASLFKPPWFDWQVLQSIVQEVKQRGQPWRSSNYRNTTLRKLRVPSHCGQARVLQSNAGVERAVLACKVVGEDAMPGACLALYEANPSRDLWKASMLTWLEQVHSKCSGCFSHYYLKCALDRAFVVRTFDHCHYLMVANRVPCVSRLVRATLPRQKPEFRGEVSSIVHDLPRTESHKNL